MRSRSRPSCARGTPPRSGRPPLRPPEGHAPGPIAPVRVGARVVEALPNALYRVELQNDARTRLTAHVPASAGLLRVLPGDLVTVEILPYDGTRGRIVGRPS